jgi:cytochrome b pre-mRNA-processing protein 3
LGDAPINMELQGRPQGAAYPRTARRRSIRPEKAVPMPSSSSSSFLPRLLGRTDPREALRPLYRAVVAEGRRPHWYVEGAVPDTLDGRFDMIVAILSLALIRLEQLEARQESVWLTELFVEDMDGQLRQEGIGDVVVGKHVGRMMSALGGRTGAYRMALNSGAALDATLRRNLYRGAPVSDAAVAHVEGALRALWARLNGLTRDALLAGDIG